MCGIAGIYNQNGIPSDGRASLERMVGAIVHRGPDSEGSFLGSQVALGMRRLSIIDLEGGSQPLFSNTKDIVLVCNGEIYNFVELRQTLEAKGYKFTTHSDCETIIHLYSEHGEKFLSHLRGMFSLALWDETQKKLIIARDRLGERPLFYSQLPDGSVYFSSEMKSLIRGPSKGKFTPDFESMAQFLTFQYVFEPNTIFQEVKKVPAGHYAVISGPGKVKFQKYWDYKYAPARHCYLKSWKTIGEEVRNKLEETVRIQLRSDVPVGVSLSGGIDSSLVASLVRRNTTQNLKAFSVGYPGRPENDEREMARKLAQSLEIEFVEIELSAKDFVESFPKLVFDMDDPIGDIAAFGYHSVSKSARAHRTPVLLSGLGADELFWGYKWVRLACMKAELKSLISKQTPHFFEGLDWVPASRTFLDGLLNQGVTLPAWNGFMQQEQGQEGAVIQLLDLHNRSWLTSNCLALTDRLSMANSIETRLPFLDHELTDLVTGYRKAGLHDLYRGHKRLLIDACKDLLPEEIFHRPKRGFTPPVTQWMSWIADRYLPLVKSGQLIQLGFLNPESIQKISNEESLGMRYRLCILELWLRIFHQRQQAADISVQTMKEVVL